MIQRVPTDDKHRPLRLDFCDVYRIVKGDRRRTSRRPASRSLICYRRRWVFMYDLPLNKTTNAEEGE